MRQAEDPRPRKSGPSKLLIALAVLGVIVPFMVWKGTWFGRTLSDKQLEEYLQDADHPRKIQHALAQISDRLIEGDTTARRFYPQVSALAHHKEPAIRTTAAWVMGQDNSSELFHRTLLEMLKDPDLMVRRNAALALVRFSDSGGRMELIAMLQPFEVRASAAGTVTIGIEPGQRVGLNALLARIDQPAGESAELRSPFSGTVGGVHAADGSQVAAGDTLLVLEPDSEQVWESLRGLYFIGRHDDIPAVARYERRRPDMPGHVRQQATLTARAIQTRSEPAATR